MKLIFFDSFFFLRSYFLMAFLFFKCICLFLAVLNLCCCTQAFPSCSEWGLFFTSQGFSVWWLLLVAEHSLSALGLVVAARGLSSCGAQALLLCSM